MAIRQIYRLNPQDFGQPKGIGISVLYSNNTSIFNSTVTTKDQIKSNLINYVLTNKGERLYDPNFGGDVRRAIFDMDDDKTFDAITTRLEKEILQYVPNIILQSIIIKRDPDNNLVNIIINYQLNQQNQQVVINVQTRGLINLIR